MRAAVPLLLLSLSGAGLAAAEPRFTAYAAGHAEVVVSRAGDDYLRLGVAAWGPKWAWTGLDGQPRRDPAGAATARFQGRMGGTGVPFHLDFRADRPEPRVLRLHYDLRAETDTELTAVVAALGVGKEFAGCEAVVVSEGKESKVRLPLGRGELGRAVSLLRLTDAAGEVTTVRLEPPVAVTADGDARIVLGAGRLAGGAARPVSVRIELPGETAWHPTAADVPDEAGAEQWYPWQATGAAGPSLVGLEEFVDAPAGRQGRVTRKGDRLFAGERPVKLWGINLCYGACSPPKELAERRAAFYRKYGINSVRLHKFADGAGWAGIQSRDSALEYDPAGLDRMDYQVAKFKEAGIYVKLSAHFGTLKLGPADKGLVPYLEEFGPFKDNPPRVTTPASGLYYSPEVQQAQAQQMVNLLKHRNPYTGLTYAEDPAVAFVEIVNEQSVLFYTSMGPLKASATLRRKVGERFCGWLRHKYGDAAALAKAWGPKSLDSFAGEGFAAGESLDRGTILPIGNPWYWDPDQLKGSQAFRRQRLLDTLEFLTGLQNEAYEGYVKAVRAAGYAGELVASNWQAGRAFSHFANLESDARVGTIDRHNYFGGRAGASMLSRAGRGMLSSGLQQVDGRPFMLSEWIHVTPNPWGVEGPAILGAYGMGLQGWDVSYLFQNGDDAAFRKELGRDQWEATAPQVLAAFPAISRHVLRGDVKEADVTAVRSVHVPSLFAGKIGFEDRVAQGYDDKELDGVQVPSRALAVVKNVVRFDDAPRETPALDLKRYEKGGMLVSSTGQLRWKEGARDPDGYFVMDTPGTQAVVGFARGQVCELGQVTIAPEGRFGALYVTARSREGTLAGSREWLVVAVGRARNTGMKFSPDGARLLEKGKPPILMEPVKARITLRRPGAATVIPLDHDGRPTDRTLPVENGSFTIDGARDRTPYYLIRF